MAIVNTLCPPALIYLCFSLTQIIIDTFKGMYNAAFFKFWIMIVFTLLLNTLCSRGLGIISWILVFVPFMLMSIITLILLTVFGLNPFTGKIEKGEQKIYDDAKDLYDDLPSIDPSGAHVDPSGAHVDPSGNKPIPKPAPSHKTCKGGCNIIPSVPDGNCLTTVFKSDNQCYKQCFRGCSNIFSPDNINSNQCNYDSDCKPGCPVQVPVPCNSNDPLRPQNLPNNYKMFQGGCQFLTDDVSGIEHDCQSINQQCSDLSGCTGFQMGTKCMLFKNPIVGGNEQQDTMCMQKAMVKIIPSNANGTVKPNNATPGTGAAGAAGANPGAAGASGAAGANPGASAASGASAANPAGATGAASANPGSATNTGGAATTP